MRLNALIFRIVLLFVLDLNKPNDANNRLAKALFTSSPFIYITKSTRLRKKDKKIKDFINQKNFISLGDLSNYEQSFVSSKLFMPLFSVNQVHDKQNCFFKNF